MAESKASQIGRYKILDELGRGGFGRVYRAYDPTVGRQVAIKVLTQVSEESLMRFRNEAMVAGNLLHGNIVTVYEYGTHDDLPFLAMEYLEGEDLHQIIASRKPVSLLEKCNIMSQVAEGLYCAHKSGVVHRDMKPANIMVLRDGTVKIMDFGIARFTRTADATRLTQQGYLIGTLRYMAPEQLAGCDLDAKCDIFAYGVIFYEFVTGRHPFEAPDAQSLIYKLTFAEPPPIREFVQGIPDALQQVISRIIHKDRGLRYQSLKEVQFDTEPIRIELRRGSAAALLSQAQELFDQERFEPAQKVVGEALDLEPSNRIARALWENLQQQIQQRTLQPRIESSLSAAEQHLAERRFTDALQAFESALLLDRDNAYIRGRIEQTKALVEHAREASQLLADARRQLEQQNLTAAYRIISEALRHDPKNPDAAEFLKTIEAFVERRQAEQRADEAIRKAQSLMLITAYDEAIAVLAALERNAESPKVQQFLEQVRIEKSAHERKQKLHNEMSSATDLLRDHKLDEALKRLEDLQKEFPENREVAHLLAYAQKEQAVVARNKAVESLAREARARVESQDFEGALAALDWALKKYPGESALIRLLGIAMAAKGAWERQQVVESTLAKCQSLRSQQRFTEAVQTVEKALEGHSAEPVLLTLLEQLQAERTRQQRNEAIKKAGDQAERLLEQRQPEAALQLVQQALMQHPGDPGLEKILRRAEEEVRTKERARAVETIGREAAQQAAAHDFDEALRRLDRGLQTWHEDAALMRQRAAVLEAKQAWEQQLELERASKRAAAIDKQVQGARVRAGAGDFDGALKLLDDGLRNWPDATSLREMREALLAERERLGKRKRALQDLQEIKLSALRAFGPSETAELLSLAAGLASKYPDDAEVQSMAAGPIGLLSDIEKVRQEIARGNFKEALEVCERHLAELPDQVAFGEFKRQAERGQRRAGVDECHRRAAAEPDLQRRVRILEDGLEQYRDESALADELRFTRNKLRLADSIVEKARACEQAGQWSEALEKWNSLLTIYDQYPGLQAEIRRLQRAWQTALEQAAEHRAQEIEQALHGGDLGGTAELLRQAQTEYPDVSRFQDLARRLQEVGEKRRRARELVAQAQAAVENGKYDECRTCLRQAFQMDQSDAVLRKLVLNKLIEYAQSAVHTDWRQAEALVSEASFLQPGYAASGTLLRAIADRKAGAAAYSPNTGQSRMAGNARSTVAQTKGEFQSPDGCSGAEIQPRTSHAGGNQKNIEAVGLARPAIPEVEQPARQAVARNWGPIAANRRRLLAGACAVTALLAGTIGLRVLRPKEIAVSATSNVSGTSVSLGGKNCVTPHCALKLAPGTYTLQAAAGGYKTVTRPFTIAPGGASVKLELALEPLPQVLQVNTNFESGQVYLDGRPEGELRDGQYTVSGIAPGPHTIRVTAGGTEFQAQWRSAAGVPPDLRQMTAGRDLQATVVANAGANGSVTCNCDVQDLAVDSASAGHVAASAGVAVPLKGLKEGARRITLGRRSLMVDIRANPTLNVFLSLDRNVGTLILQTGEDKVKVFLNNQLYRRTTEHGMLRIPTDVGKYSVRVEKEGFLSPEPRTVALKKGEEKPVVFALTRALAYLNIQGAATGAQVKLDGQRIGETDRIGAFRHEVTPGPHTIELTKDDYVPVRVSEQFGPGEVLELDHKRVAMTKAAKRPSPDPKQVEAQEWARIGTSTNPDDFDEFIRNHPASAHLEQARSRAGELRHQAQANAAQQLEQAAWDKVDQNNKGQLQEYMSRFPAGAHAQEARARIAEVDRSAGEALASQRLKEQKDQEQTKRAADDQMIVEVLKDFDAAYNRRDLAALQRLWSGVPVAAYRQQFREATDLQFQLQLVGQPAVSGNSATAICTRTLTYRGRSGASQTHSERVKVTLSREASGWLIRAIHLN